MGKKVKRNNSVLRIERKCDFIITLITHRNETEIDELVSRMRAAAKELSEHARAEKEKGYGE